MLGGQRSILDAKLWTIPAVRMKAKREHIVPLSPQALEILEVMKPISAHREHVFPSRNDPEKTDEQPNCECCFEENWV